MPFSTPTSRIVVRWRACGALLLVAGLTEGPPDTGGELGGTDGSGQGGALREGAHGDAPEAGTAGPGVRIAGGMDEGHYAIADEDHGGEMGGTRGSGVFHVLYEMGKREDRCPAADGAAQ